MSKLHQSIGPGGAAGCCYVKCLSNVDRFGRWGGSSGLRASLCNVTQPYKKLSAEEGRGSPSRPHLADQVRTPRWWLSPPHYLHILGFSCFSPPFIVSFGEYSKEYYTNGWGGIVPLSRSLSLRPFLRSTPNLAYL